MSLTVWTRRRGWMVRKTSEKKKKSRQGPRAIGDAKDGRRRRREEDASLHTHMRARARTSYVYHLPRDTSKAQYREPFPLSWQLRHVAATTKHRDSFPALPPPLVRPVSPYPARCNTQHLHTILISYLSIARIARASPHTRASYTG